MTNYDDKTKAAEIQLVLLQPQVDLWRLRELAISPGGLVNESLRQRAWPKLVGLSSNPSKQQKEEHKHQEKLDIGDGPDNEQIDRDVARCTWHLLTGNQRSKKFQYTKKAVSKKISTLLKKKQAKLGSFCKTTLNHDVNSSKQNRLCYYQGYHDVASIVWSVLGSDPAMELPRQVLWQLSSHHFAICMQDSFADLQALLKGTIYPLLWTFDAPLHDVVLYQCGMSEPYFCLSWILTWFSHDVRDTELVQRLFDVLMVSHSTFCLYLAVAMMIHPTNRNIVINMDDFASLHQALQELPRHSSLAGYTVHRRPVDGSWVYVSDDVEEEPLPTTSSPYAGAEGQSVTVASTAEVSIPEDLTPEDEDPALMSKNASTKIQFADYEATSLQPPQVSFEELIGLALKMMQAFPPLTLAKLGHRYAAAHPGTEVASPPVQKALEELQKESPTPDWMTAPAALSDWVWKQQLRAQQGKSVTTRKDRRKLSNDDASSSAASSAGLPIIEQEYLTKYPSRPAAVALGLGGPTADEVRMLRRKQRRRRRRQAALVVICLVAVAAFAMAKTDKDELEYSLVKIKNAAGAWWDRFAGFLFPSGGSSSSSSSLQDSPASPVLLNETASSFNKDPSSSSSLWKAKPPSAFVPMPPSATECPSPSIGLELAQTSLPAARAIQAWMDREQDNDSDDQRLSLMPSALDGLLASWKLTEEVAPDDRTSEEESTVVSGDSNDTDGDSQKTLPRLERIRLVVFESLMQALPTGHVQW